MAHALNNLLGLVHLAHSRLEAAPLQAEAGALRALERACSEGRYASAMLALFALNARKIEAALEGGRFDWDRYEIASLQDWLVALGDVACAFPHSPPDVRADFSPTLLRSLLTCAVSEVRQYSPGNASICVRLRVAPVGPDGCHLVSFAVVPEARPSEVTLPRVSAAESAFRQVPLGHLALHHFASLAERVRASVLVDPGRGVRLDVRARPAVR